MARDETARERGKEESLLDRRSYLRLAGAAAASVGLAGTGASTSTSDNTLLHEDFEDSDYDKWFNWAYVQGPNDHVTSSDSVKGDSCLEVELPEGEADHGMHARCDPKELGLTDSNLQELYAQFWIKFPSDFEGSKYVSKTNGPRFNEPEGPHAGEPSDGTNGWSALSGFTGGTSVGEKQGSSDVISYGYYIYHMDQRNDYADWEKITELQRGKWYKVEQHIKLNTVSNGSANYDGELRMWIDDSLEFERTDYRFTEMPERGVNYGVHAYYGGTMSSPKDQSIFMDEWTLAKTKPSDNQTDSSSSTTSTDDQQTSSEGTVLEIVSGDNMSTTSYQFTVEGQVTKRTSASDTIKAEDNDSVTDNGDGTVTVQGATGNGYGDSYLVDGTIISTDLDESKWTVRYGGNEVSLQDIVLPNKLVIDGSNHPRAASDYTFQVSGTAKKNAKLGSINDYDSVSNGKITGRVIGGKDGYRFSGEVTGFSLDGPANVHVQDG